MKHVIAFTVKTKILNRAFFGVDEAYTAVLTGLGLPADQVEAIKGVTAETLKDFKAENFVTPIRTNLETTFLNDPTFLSKITKEKIPEAVRKDIESGQYGRFMNEYKDYATKTLGLDLSDLTPEEQKSLKGVAEKVTTKYAGKLGTPEALKTVQAELQKALGDNAAKDSTHAETLKTTVAQTEANYQGLLTKLLTQTQLAGIEGGLVVPAEMVADSILEMARQQYTLKLEGTQIVIKRKDNPELDAVNSDGTKVTFNQVIKAIATEKQLVKKATETKTEEEGRVTATTVEVNGNTVKLPGNIAAKVAANLKAESSAAK